MLVLGEILSRIAVDRIEIEALKCKKIEVNEKWRISEEDYKSFFFRRWFINKVAYTRSSSRVRRYQRSFFSFSGCKLISASVSQPIFFLLSITLVPPARHIRAHSKVDNGLVGRVHAKREWMKERKSALLVVFWELPVRPWKNEEMKKQIQKIKIAAENFSQRFVFIFCVWWYFFFLLY